ncbi:sigma-70 family RNA polymerase sigma factor [Rubritalea tangerina]|uniref:Sigma-70 family RNA polymerase sigma factor n=1 Tax=Rubritalea tangerina TaxID=430798 RepID=A0ABW4Z9N7_9BACT
MENQPESLQNFVQLMTQHQGAVRAFIVSLMPGRPEVNDVLQETNLTLWRKRDTFQEGTNFIAWAFTIARYEVMRQRSKDKRDHRLQFSDSLLDALSAPPEPDSHESPKLLALERCLSKLSTIEREIIRHRYTAGKSIENLSQHLAKSPGSLRIALFRVRASLKKCIEKNLLKGDLA